MLVLLLQAGERRVLLPSDVESDGLAGVLPLLDDKPIDVLMAPHHGSHVDGLPSMLQRLQPEHVVLSARECPFDKGLLVYRAVAAKVALPPREGELMPREGLPFLLEDLLAQRVADAVIWLHFHYVRASVGENAPDHRRRRALPPPVAQLHH